MAQVVFVLQVEPELRGKIEEEAETALSAEMDRLPRTMSLMRGAGTPYLPGQTRCSDFERLQELREQDFAGMMANGFGMAPSLNQ